MPSEALTVRPAGPDDLSAVADLFLASRSDIQGMHYSACCNLDLAQLSRS